MSYETVWNIAKTAVFPVTPSTDCLPVGPWVDATLPLWYPEDMELPKGQGWYTKRGVVYLAISVQREKFVSSTKWRVDDSSLTARKLNDFKQEKIAEASKLLGVSKIQRNITVSALFKNYLEHLRKHEQEKGE